MLLAIVFEKWWLGQTEWIVLYYGEETYDSIAGTQDHLDQLVNL